MESSLGVEPILFLVEISLFYTIEWFWNAHKISIVHLWSDFMFTLYYKLLSHILSN